LGVYNEKIKLPNRFTQVIIRGLQGIVNADNRYTIRFTRDFTLRDEIDTYPIDSFGTDTRFGLGDDQAFVDGKLALNSVISYLLDPNVDFTPVDINEFLKNNNFDTNDDIISTMEQIYNTFTYTHVNRIFFSVLHDAFSTKAKYNDIFKTSMVSLHGIRPFQTSGIFDD